MRLEEPSSIGLPQHSDRSALRAQLKGLGVEPAALLPHDEAFEGTTVAEVARTQRPVFPRRASRNESSGGRAGGDARVRRPVRGAHAARRHRHDRDAGRGQPAVAHRLQAGQPAAHHLRLAPRGRDPLGARGGPSEDRGGAAADGVLRRCVILTAIPRRASRDSSQPSSRSTSSNINT